MHRQDAALLFTAEAFFVVGDLHFLQKDGFRSLRR